MTNQDRAILSVCAHTSVQCISGVGIELHPLTRKQLVGLRLSDMLIEDPAVWEEREQYD